MILKTAKDFYDFFAAIPWYKWTVRTTKNKWGQRCAIGHLEAAGRPTENLYNLRKLLRAMPPRFGCPEVLLDQVNDWGIAWRFNGTTYRPDKVYKQWTAKGRVMALLKDAMKVGL